VIHGDEQRLGSQYVLDERIGRGAMGVVWRGRDTDTGEPVAIKILAEELSEDPDVLARFVQERTVLIGLRHPNLVAVHDMVVERNRLALVMDLVSGGDLLRLLKQNGVLTPAQAAGLAAQICAALQAIHAAGVVHRDLKPANVLLDLDGPQPVVRLADFGVARMADRSRITAHTSIVGTPSYLAPELIRGEEPVPAGDVYALGVTVYELLTGRPPFNGGTVLTVLHRHLEDQAVRIPGVPDSLWSIIEACLEKDPESRPSAAAVGGLLVKALPELIGVPAASPAPAAADWLSDEESGHTGSVVYAMPSTFYGGGSVGASQQSIPPLPGAQASLLDQASPSQSHPSHPQPHARAEVEAEDLTQPLSSAKPHAWPAQSPAGSADPTEQIPVVRAASRGYGAGPGPAVGFPAAAGGPAAGQFSGSGRSGGPEADGSGTLGGLGGGSLGGREQFGGSGPADSVSNGPAFSGNGPFSGGEQHGGSGFSGGGPFSAEESFGGSSRRRRRTAVVAGSVVSVVLVSAAVALAVANSGSSTPQPARTDGVPGIEAGGPEGVSVPAITLSAGPTPSAATTTASASAGATPTATATRSRAATAKPSTAAPSASATVPGPPDGNYAFDAAVTVSSTVTPATGWAASNLTNGNFSPTTSDKGWASKKDTAAASTEWVSLDLPTAAQILDVNLYPRNYDGTATCFPTAFTIATSTDGKSWTTVTTRTGYSPSGVGPQRFSFQPVTAKYIKVTATSLTQDQYKDYYFQLQQISAYD
jgi:serine/threonine protein kinase, bacterial